MTKNRVPYRILVDPAVNLILPQETLWDTLENTVKGFLAAMGDSRAAYESAVEKRVIKDTVLAQATNMFLPFDLFQKLQNPLLKKYDFDSEEFLEAAKPALQHFHGLSMNLENELPLLLRKDVINWMKSNGLSDITKSRERFADLCNPELGINLWREQVKKDDSSVYNQFAKITTTNYFDSLYYMSAQTIYHIGAPPARCLNCEIGEVALLNARAMIIDKKADASGENQIHETSNSTTDNSIENVAAQVDVLYEVTHTYRPMIAKDWNISNDESETIQNEADSTRHSGMFKLATLKVAIFEGWLNGGPDSNSLNWKIPMIREANEFNYSPTTIKAQ